MLHAISVSTSLLLHYQFVESTAKTKTNPKYSDEIRNFDKDILLTVENFVDIFAAFNRAMTRFGGRSKRDSVKVPNDSH